MQPHSLSTGHAFRWLFWLSLLFITLLLAGNLARREAATVEVTTIDEAMEVGRTGFARIPWSAVGSDGEAALNAKTLSVRCLQRPDGSLPSTADEPGLVAVVARSY